MTRTRKIEDRQDNRFFKDLIIEPKADKTLTALALVTTTSEHTLDGRTRHAQNATKNAGVKERARSVSTLIIIGCRRHRPGMFRFFSGCVHELNTTPALSISDSVFRPQGRGGGGATPVRAPPAHADSLRCWLAAAARRATAARPGRASGCGAAGQPPPGPRPQGRRRRRRPTVVAAAALTDSAGAVGPLPGLAASASAVSALRSSGSRSSSSAWRGLLPPLLPSRPLLTTGRGCGSLSRTHTRGSSMRSVPNANDVPN